MEQRFEELGKVKHVFFGREDHGILSFMIDIDFGSSGQGFGGYALDTYSKDDKRRVGTAAGTDLILRILDLFQIRELSDAVGKPVYAIKKSETFNELIIGLKTPKFDGSRILMISDWQEYWFPKADSDD